MLPATAIATLPEGQPVTARAAVVAAESPHSFFPAGLCGADFDRGRGGRKRRLAWVATLPIEQKQLTEGAWQVRGDALLPSGKTVQQIAQSPICAPIPDAVKRGSRKVKARDLAERTIAERDREFQAQHPSLGPTTDAYVKLFNRTLGPALADQRSTSGCKLRTGRAALLALRERVARGEVNGWHRCGAVAKEHDGRLIKRLQDRYLHPNKLDGADAYGEQRRLAVQLGIEPMTPWAVRKLIGEIPQPAKVLGRHGPREFEKRCVPKIRVDYTDLPAGDWLCLDGRVPDVQVRIPDGSGG